MAVIPSAQRFVNSLTLHTPQDEQTLAAWSPVDDKFSLSYKNCANVPVQPPLTSDCDDGWTFLLRLAARKLESDCQHFSKLRAFLFLWKMIVAFKNLNATGLHLDRQNQQYPVIVGISHFPDNNSVTCAHLMRVFRRNNKLLWLTGFIFLKFLFLEGEAEIWPAGVSNGTHTYLCHPDPEKTDRRNDEWLIMRVIITILMHTFTHTS